MKWNQKQHLVFASPFQRAFSDTVQAKLNILFIMSSPLFLLYFAVILFNQCQGIATFHNKIQDYFVQLQNLTIGLKVSRDNEARNDSLGSFFSEDNLIETPHRVQQCGAHRTRFLSVNGQC